MVGGQRISFYGIEMGKLSGGEGLGRLLILGSATELGGDSRIWVLPLSMVGCGYGGPWFPKGGSRLIKKQRVWVLSQNLRGGKMLL